MIRQWRKGFTLIELLVVIALIGIIIAILFPALARVKERGRRAVCLNNIHQFIIGIVAYASENHEHLPSGLSDKGIDEHTPIIASATRDTLVSIIGNEQVLRCPWLREPFTNPDSWFYQDYADYGYLIGYNYLGGHQETPWNITYSFMANTEWTSPQSNTENGNSPIVTELNTWTVGQGVTFAPHGRRGPVVEYSRPELLGDNPSKEIGAEGGNVGLLDGSVSWKKMEDMKIYRGSRLYPNDGCITAW